MSEQEKKQCGTRRRNTGTGNALPLPLRAIWKALPLSLAAGTLLSVLATLILLKTGDPGRYASSVGTALLYPVAALFGALTVRFSDGRPPLFGGLLAGSTLLALLLAVGLILPHSANACGRPLIVGLYAAVPVSALCGALLSARRPARRRKKSKRTKGGR